IFGDQKIEYNKIDNVNFFNSQQYNITFKHQNYYKENFKKAEIQIKESVSLDVHANNELYNIWDHLKIIEDFRSFLYLLTNFSCQTDLIQLESDSEDGPVFFRSIKRIQYKTSSVAVSSIKYSEIKDNLSDIYKKWIENIEIKTSVELILEKSINNFLSRENYFLNTCFAIEILNRRFHNENPFKKHEFKSLKLKMIENLDEGIKEFVQSKLAHFNEPNFKQRLFFYKDDLEKLKIQKYSADEFIKKIVD